MGDVGIEEELDLIGVPHFGGPKVSKGREREQTFFIKVAMYSIQGAFCHVSLVLGGTE